MTICPVLTDLKTQVGTIRTVLRAVRHDLSLCERCNIKCDGYRQYQGDLKIAITQTLTDIQEGGIECPKPLIRKSP